MRKVVVVGTGGLAREFASYFSGVVEVVGWCARDDKEHAQFNLGGKLFPDEMTPETTGVRDVVVAIGAPGVRERVHQRLKAAGFEFPAFAHPSSVVAGHVSLAEGAIISPGCVVSPNVSLGRLVYVNFCCGVGHDAVLGDYVQVNPGCQLGGFSKIGDKTLVGSGSTILHGVSVGAGVTVSSGSVVFARVADNAKVMGNPARRLRAFED